MRHLMYDPVSKKEPKLTLFISLGTYFNYVDNEWLRELEVLIFCICLTHVEHRNLDVFSFQRNDRSNEMIRILF